MAEAIHSLPPALAKLVGTTIADAYRLDGVLGAGNMGVVFSGVQLKLKRPVAVKVLDPAIADSERSARRFAREAESVARLDHVNCLQVYDFGTTDTNLHYMVMPRLEGRPLDALVGEGTLSPRRALELTAQVLAGLAHAHDQGLVHRDLKPSNILVEEHGDPQGAGDVVKIVDFGIAKIVDDDASFQTRTGMLFGTPAYMSPEQALGEAIDGRSDLYSAGLVLYRLIAGDVPHRARTLVEQMRRRVTLEVPALPSPCPPPVIELIDRLCALEMDERFPDANRAREAVLAVLEAAPDSAPMWDLAMAPVSHALDEDAGTLVDDEGTEPDCAANDGVSTLDGIEPDSAGSQTSRTGPSPRSIDDDEAEEATGDIDHVVRPAAAGSQSSAAEDSREAVVETGAPARWGIVGAIVVGVALGGLGLWWTLRASPDDSRPTEVNAAAHNADVAEPRDDTRAASLAPGTESAEATEDATNEPETGDGAPDPSRRLIDDLRRVNVPEQARALTLADRHALLEVLRADASIAPLVDEVRNALLDLEQASQAAAPCEVFAAALARLEHERGPEVRRALRKARVPRGARASCAAAQRKLDRVRGSRRADQDGEVVATETEPREEARPGEITHKLGGLR